MSSIGWIAWNLIRRTAGTRRGLLVVFVLPIVMIAALIGLFGRTTSEPARIAFVSEDSGPFGQRIAAALEEEPLYRIERLAVSREALKQMVDEGQADAALYVPESFTTDALSGRPVPIELFRESAQFWNTALLLDAESEVRRLTGLAGAARMQHGTVDEQALPAALEPMAAATGYHPEVKRVTREASNSFVLVVGLTVMFVMIMANQAVAQVAEDRAAGTMARMFAAPVQAYQIAAGQCLGCVLLGLGQLTLILVIVRYVMQFPLGAPFGLVLLVMAVFLLAAVGLAAAAAGAVRNPLHLSQINTLIVVPTSILGGVFWPADLMPAYMQKLSYFMPQRWAIKAVEELAAGGSLQAIALHLGILLLFAAVFLSFGAFLFQPAVKQA